MRSATRFFPILAVLLAFARSGSAQADAICGETGGTTWLNTSYVYGKVRLNGFEGRKLPKITVVLYDRRQSENRYTIDRSGNYCFRDVNGSGGFLVVEVEGMEVARRSIPPGGIGPVQHRQDFDVQPTHPDKQRAPGSISAKYNYPRSEKNAALFEKAIAAEKEKAFGTAVQLLKEIVTNDPADFVAWAKLGSVYFDQDKFSEAESAYLKAISLRGDYAPAMINLGRIHLVRKQFDAAIEILQKATQTEPTAARAFQLLGEAYLLTRKGTLGVAALNEAIRLDPIGMAECHLLMARLYDLAGAKPLASREYRMFLEKVPEHQDKKRFERYIKDHPEENAQN
jgi:Flp pilus assembly protein TadD